ncbi:MAG TPA: hypothetical protein VMF13_15495 [Luteitalea sp.]|nr:hypothetical protein [Luteitalea sp.]
MKIIRHSVLAFIVLAGIVAVAAAQTSPPAGSGGLVDSRTTLASRIGEADPSVLKMFADAGMGTPTPHRLTDDERSALVKAMDGLPPVHQRVLRERLRRISFLDGMPNTALTSTVNPDDAVRVYDLTIRAGVLRETTSQFLTWKERGCFDLANSSRTVDVEAGSLDAIVYVLLHEATHMVDNALGLTPPPADPVSASRPSALVDGIWTNRLTIAAPYAGPLLEGLTYRRGGRAVPIADADAVYAALRRTPFVSLYASSNWHDDVAELVAWHYLTSRLRQPYRIVVRDAGREVLSYEPMAAPLVQARLRLLTSFYDDGRVAP